MSASFINKKGGELMGLKGDISTMSMWEIFQLISISKKNGKLQLEYNENLAEVYFSEGKIVYAKSGKLEGIDALIDIFLWSKGNFNFLQNINPPKSTMTLDIFEVLFQLDTYVDKMNYFSDFILVPINMEDLSEEEYKIVSILDGIKNVKEIIGEYKGIKTEGLENIIKLNKDKKIIRITDDTNIFWFYLFCRIWDYLIKESNKLKINEQKLRDFARKFIDRSGSYLKEIFKEIISPYNISPLHFYKYIKEETINQEDIENVYENLIYDEKIPWDHIYKTIKDFSHKAIQDFVKDFLIKLFSIEEPLYKKYLDLNTNHLYQNFSDNQLRDLYIYNGEISSLEEEILSWFLNGNRNLETFVRDFIFDEKKNLIIFSKLIDEGKIISIFGKEKSTIIHKFIELWKDIKNEYKNNSKYIEIYKKVREFIDKDSRDTRFIVEKIIEDYPINWRYILNKLTLISEEEVKLFTYDILSLFEVSNNPKLKDKISTLKASL